MQVRRPQSEKEIAGYYRLRWQILRAPWAQPAGSERDEQEESAEHALITDESGEPLAVGRLHFNTPDQSQIRYMAVAEHARGRGLGRAIVGHLEAVARAQGSSWIVLNARDSVVDFYAKLGYEAVGAGPTMFGEVAHVRMRKRL